MKKLNIEIIEKLLIRYGVSTRLFWGEYQEELDKIAEFNRAFVLNDAMKIKGVKSGGIDKNYVEINHKFKISLRHKKETIAKIIKRKLFLAVAKER